MEKSIRLLLTNDHTQEPYELETLTYGFEGEVKWSNLLIDSNHDDWERTPASVKHLVEDMAQRLVKLEQYYRNYRKQLTLKTRYYLLLDPPGRIPH